MTVFQAIVLGIIQGLTEFLPVSSSAHLALAPILFNWNPEHFTLAFDVSLHVGTLVAVLWYFRADWVAAIQAAFSIVATRNVDTIEKKRVVFMFLALLPAIAAGLLLEDAAETTFRSPLVMASALILLGILLWVADRRSTSVRSLDSMRWPDALLMGIAQACALVPGVSRSGATMTAGRLLAFDRVSAARFSFLMSMPVIAAAAVRKVPDALREDGITVQLMAGMAAAAITGWLAIGFLLRFLATKGFAPFAIYRIILGMVVYAILFAGV